MPPKRYNHIARVPEEWLRGVPRSLIHVYNRGTGSAADLLIRELGLNGNSI